MVVRKHLPPADHVMRYVQYNRQERDADTDAYLGVAPGAFMRGAKDQGGMSVTWVEHFGAYGAPAKRDAAIAFRNSQPSKKIGSKALFATANVQSVLDAGATFSKALRVVHDPVPENTGHTEVRHFDDDDLELLDMLASQVFTDIDLVADLALSKA